MEGWIDVAGQTDLPVNDVVAVKAGGREIALYAIDGKVYATDRPSITRLVVRLKQSSSTGTARSRRPAKVWESLSIPS